MQVWFIGLCLPLLVFVLALFFCARNLLRKRKPHPGLALLVVAQTAHALWAPACVYLARAPGSVARSRFLLGANRSGDVCWLEGEQSLAVAFGPRWWFVLNPHALPGTGGIEWIPPLRYGRESNKNQWLRCLRGNRVRVDWRPALPDESVYAWPRRVVSLSGGAFLLDTANGRYRVDSVTGVAQRPSGSEVSANATARVLSGSLAEKEGSYFLGAELIDEDSGVRTGTRSIRLPGDPSVLVGAEVLRADEKYFLVVLERSRDAPSSGRAELYQLDSSLETTSNIGRVPLAGSRVAISPHGNCFFAGDGVYSADGRRLLPLGGSVRTAVFSGESIYAVVPDRRIGFDALERRKNVGPRVEFGALESRLAGVPNPTLVPRPDGWEPALPPQHAHPWLMGGWDESGSEDLIVVANVRRLCSP